MRCDVGPDFEELEGWHREFRAVITRDPLPVVIGDEGQLAQLFQNLLD